MSPIVLRAKGLESLLFYSCFPFLSCICSSGWGEGSIIFILLEWHTGHHVAAVVGFSEVDLLSAGHLWFTIEAVQVAAARACCHGLICDVVIDVAPVLGEYNSFLGSTGVGMAIVTFGRLSKL